MKKTFGEILSEAFQEVRDTPIELRTKTALYHTVDTLLADAIQKRINSDGFAVTGSFANKDNTGHRSLRITNYSKNSPLAVTPVDVRVSYEVKLSITDKRSGGYRSQLLFKFRDVRFVYSDGDLSLSFDEAYGALVDKQVNDNFRVAYSRAQAVSEFIEEFNKILHKMRTTNEPIPSTYNIQRAINQYNNALSMQIKLKQLSSDADKFHPFDEMKEAVE